MIYDCFTFFNELDLLEIRFNILDPYVDFFVLGESTETFSGKEKPLNYEINKERFAKWNHKVIHIVSPKYDTPDAFERARLQKEYLKTGLTKAKNEDLIYYGDVDEIWKPQEITDYQVYNLEQLNYCYYLNRRSSERWVGTIIGKWLSVRQRDFRDWRANHDFILPNGGWHFTNMNGAEQIRKKLEAYDHQEMNTLENQTLVEERMKDGEDYAGRSVDWEGNPFRMWKNEVDLPQYLLDNKEKYATYFS